MKEKLPVTRMYAYKEHVRRMGIAWKPAVSYQAFCARISKWMSVKEAIDKPANQKMIHNMVNMIPKKSWWEVLLSYFKRC